MKRTFFCCLTTLLITATASAQLAKTKWTGTMKIPGEGGSLASMPVTWTFTKDTLTVDVSGGQPEMFTFKDVKKVLMMTKVSGGSPCPDGAKVTFTYSVTKDELTFINQTSDCETYNKSTAEAPLKKVK